MRALVVSLALWLALTAAPAYAVTTYATIEGASGGDATKLQSLWQGETVRFGVDCIQQDSTNGEVASSWSGQPSTLWQSRWPYDPEPSGVATNLATAQAPCLVFEYVQRLSFSGSNPVDGTGGFDLWGSYAYTQMEDADNSGDAAAGLYLGSGNSKTVPSVYGAGGSQVYASQPTAGANVVNGSSTFGVLHVCKPRVGGGWSIYTYMGYLSLAARSGKVVWRLPVVQVADDEGLRERIGDTAYQSVPGFLAWVDSGSKLSYTWQSRLLRAEGASALTVAQADTLIAAADTAGEDWGDNIPDSFDASGTAAPTLPELPSGLQSFFDDFAAWLTGALDPVRSLLWPVTWAADLLGGA